MDELLFPPGSVPVAVAAKVFGKDANWELLQKKTLSKNWKCWTIWCKKESTLF